MYLVSETFTYILSRNVHCLISLFYDIFVLTTKSKYGFGTGAFTNKLKI